MTTIRDSRSTLSVVPSDGVPASLRSADVGTRALSRVVLQALVEARYGAALAGDLCWAERTVDEIHRAAGVSRAPSIDHTRAALSELEAGGLVDRCDAADTWIATPHGATALEDVQPQLDVVSPPYLFAA